MIGACGAAVCGLHRERIGALSLADYELPEGGVRRCGPREEALLRSMLPSHRVAEHAKRESTESSTVEGVPAAVA